jgi:signal transduction histidine kinase
MVWNAVPVAILAGITSYAALTFYGLYLALARVADIRLRREYLMFALTCVAGVAYDVCCVGLYGSESLDQGVFWMRGSLLTAACIGVAYQAFVWEFLKAKMPRVLRFAAWGLVALGLTVALWDSPHTFTTARPAIKHLTVFGQDIVYHEGEAGIVDQVLMLLFFTVYAVNVGYLVRYHLLGGRTQNGKIAFLVALVISGATATSDFLVTGQVYKFLYLFEYGFAAILMAMAYILLMRFVELHGSVNQLNNELARANTGLVVALGRAQESIQVKTEFLASMSHELRTPLNAIINLPEQLIQEFQTKSRATCHACSATFELDEGEELDEHASCGACGAHGLGRGLENYFVIDTTTATRWLGTIGQASRNLLGLVDDVLDASKLELGHTAISRTEFDATALIAEVVDSAQAIAVKRGIVVRLDVLAEYAPPVAIVADRTKLSQVLFNLIGNAVKFSYPGGTVEVQYFQPSPGESRINVRDHGPGIAKQHHQLIFEKFRQVDSGATRTHGGTGLGLAISKSLVELHGGSIWLDSVEGEGATFFVRLPRLTIRDDVSITHLAKEERAPLPVAV